MAGALITIASFPLYLQRLEAARATVSPRAFNYERVGSDREFE
jgi:hypothetical protein